MNAQTKRPRGRPPKVHVTPYADLGPSIRREVLPGAATARVATVDRPDPDKPQGADARGARAVIIYEWLHHQRMISDEQREAADRYLVRVEQASGAIEFRAERIPGLRNDGAPGGPTERQVFALTDLRNADEILGSDRDMVREVVAWNREPERGLDVARFRNALGRMATWWGM